MYAQNREGLRSERSAYVRATPRNGFPPCGAEDCDDHWEDQTQCSACCGSGTKLRVN